MSIFSSREAALAAFPRATESFLRRNVIGETQATNAPAALAPPPPPVPKRARKVKVARTRNMGTMTEAMFWGKVRSELRRAFRWWKPALAALQRQRIASKGPRGRKWLFRCEGCGGLFMRKQVQIDHRVPCGSLTDYAHVGDFLRRLCCESPDDYAILCRDKCHQEKTNAERAAK